MPPADAVPGIARRRVLRVRDGIALEVDDAVTEEVPVAFSVDGEAFAVMLATPCDPEDFAVGFAFTEGLIEAATQLQIVGIEPRLEGIAIDLQMRDGVDAASVRQRALPGRSGCGLCGATTLEDAVSLPPPVLSECRITITAVQRALQALRARQPLNAVSGSAHAAAFADASGALHLVREDIGRHNALDKLIGALLREGCDAGAGFAVVTSRASVELVTKAARAGIPMLVAVSGATALAIDAAHSCGITLVGFARDDGHALYTHPRRLQETA